MSRYQEDSGESQHYLKLPENFNIVEPFLVPPAEISTADDLRFNKYVVCSNLRSLKSGGRYESRSDEFPVRDETWRVELFGDYEQFLFDDEDGNKQPCYFERFFYRILYELRCPTEPPPNVNIWVQFDLVSSPQILLKSQLHWIAAFHDYWDAFISDRRGCSTVWFYFQFMTLPATSMNGPSDVTINWVTEWLSYDAIQVHVLPEHVESSYDGSQILDTFVNVDTPQEDPASSSADDRVLNFRPPSSYEDSSGQSPDTTTHSEVNNTVQPEPKVATTGIALYDNVRHVRLSHCKLAVTPYQFCTAVRILFKENDTGVGGGFLALSPGIGKTYIVLFAYALRTLLLTNKREVLIEWADTDKAGKSKRRKNHLPRDAPPGQRLRCPSEKPGFGVRCYCVPDGLTRLTVDRLKPGLTLIQVPNGAMPGWLSAIKDAKFEPSVYNVVLFHPAAAMPSGLQTNSGAISALKRAIRVGATLPVGHPGGRIEHQCELDWHMQGPPLTKNFMALESYCFVTTHYSSAIEEEFRYGLNDLDPRPARVTELPDADNKCYALLCGMTFVDESHQALTPASKTVQMAQIHRHIRVRGTGGSDIWHVTATPFGAKFENVLSAVSLLAPHLNDDLERLKNAYELARTSNDPDVHVAFECQFHLVFDAKLVIRDLETTTFLGRSITDIQPVAPKLISSVTPEAHVEAIQGLIDDNLRASLQEHLSSYVDYHRAMRAAGITDELYFISLFPSMADAIHNYVLPDVAYMDRTLGQLIRELSDTTGESIATIKLLTDAVELYARGPRSPKVQDILKEISRMVRDTSTQRPDPDKELAKLHGGPGTKVDLTLKKMVIITPTLSTAVFLYLYLSRYHHSYNPLLYHQALKASAKAAVLKKFDSLKNEKNPYRVLVAPAQVAGAGLNLQVANRLILTSPLLSRSDEKQALARINRTGQTLQVHIKILVMEDSPIDRIILAERARRAILSDPFRLDEDLVTISPVIFAPRAS
ncbi:hypothetical protein SLS53_004980 [Cytospora paraplurivora]|uniref:Helicase C-terminal domain-containing protein n=1 Tax=Cytospora paraplurivora TaxID=2898453 RepID=A0AAN9YGK1_9PEZI